LLEIVQTIDDSHFSRFHTKHGRARYWHVSQQSKHSKPSSNCNKKPVDRAAPTVDDDVADDVVESASGTLHCRAAFLCKIAPILTPEGIALIGNKWRGAHNKTICAVLRVHDARCCAVRHHTRPGAYGGSLAQKYDRLRANSPRAEFKIVGPGRFLRSGQPAYRGHSDNVAAIVVSLFA
jgi:hypothetical protein